ncbi:MAG TPA: hypothetical protein DDX98_11930 [Bacteroidales bacterium]|nr:hypothetical protein [Bacteroidales bacterium]
MNRTQSSWWIVFGFLQLTSIAYCQEQAKAGENSMFIEIRQPDTSFFSAYKADKDFIYQSNLVDENIFWLTIKEQLGRFFETTSDLFLALPILFQVLVILMIIAFLFVAITKTKVYKVFYTQDKPAAYVSDAALTEEQELDLQIAIQQAEVMEAYRNAVRYHFLRVLETLELAHLIRYSREKTNRDYGNEIINQEIQSEFWFLSNMYNLVWYGYAPVNRENYKQLADRFLRFCRNIHEEH